MHCVSTEFRKDKDGKWEAVDKLIQPQGNRCMVLLDPPKTHSEAGIELVEGYQDVTWEGKVVASGPQSAYCVGDRVVVGQHAGIQERYPGRKALYVVATDDEIIHRVSVVVRAPNEHELAKLTEEADAKERLAKARADLVAKMSAETESLVQTLSNEFTPQGSAARS